MSTRSIIGYRKVEDPNTVHGVYHHFDGYPTGLGAELHRAYDLNFDTPMSMVIRLIINTPQGWSSLDANDLSGSYAAGDHDMIYECQCGKGVYDLCSPLFTEWMYVITSEGLEVWKSVNAGGDVPFDINNPDQGYRHVYITTVRWDAEEVDWQAIEDDTYTYVASIARGDAVPTAEPLGTYDGTPVAESH